MDRDAGGARAAGARKFFRGELLVQLKAYVQHEAELSADEGGKPRREHLKLAAKRGNPRALEALDGPPFPEPLRYLYDWLLAVHGRSGVGFAGINPLTWECLDAWARMTDRTVYPHEAQALMELDAVLRLATAPKKVEQPKPERRRA